IMAISQANLLSRNIIKEIRPNLSPQAEARISKWASVVFKFLALGFIFLIPSQYALSLQLIGGILIVQTLPPIFIGLYTKWLDKNALIAGWVVGIVSGLYILEAANKFGAPTSVLYNSGPLGLLYVAATALALNLLVAVVWSAVANATKTKAKAQEQASVK
ncbi:MAG TPA: sodium:solute symporter, partial [Thermoplasmataceae archaeon]|nr:sodium:solute symporter [Thermoplasmataceae archaeon]